MKPTLKKTIYSMGFIGLLSTSGFSQSLDFSAAEFFHKASFAHIEGKTQQAEATLLQGLSNFPTDPKLLRFKEYLDELRKQKEEEQKKQDQEKDKQKGDDSKDQNQDKSDSDNQEDSDDKQQKSEDNQEDSENNKDENSNDQLNK